MTISDHPARSEASARGDLAERLVPVAAELAFTVRTEDREGIGAWLDAHGITEPAARSLLVVTAAMVDVDATPEAMLAWVTWDDGGEPLDGTLPLFPPAGDGADPLPLRALETPVVAAAIRGAREAARMTRRQLAEAAGVGGRMVSKWENGERRPGLETWDRLLEVLGPLGVVRDAGPETAAREESDRAA